MKLSIIIPVYNVENSLEKCVDSVINQSFTDFELILIDDGSTDNSSEIADNLSTKDKRIKVVHQSNKGLSQARNAGIDIAKGEYITFIDSDDFIHKDTLNYLINIINIHPEYDIIEYPVIERYASPYQHKLSFPQKSYTNLKDYWITTNGFSHCYAWNKIFKSKLFYNVRFPKNKTFEDVFTIPILLEKANVIATIDKGLYYYYFNTNSITNNAKGTDIANLLQAHIYFIKKHGDIMNSKYYKHLLNIQIDVYEATSYDPILPILKYNNSIKLKLLHIIGMKKLCKLIALIHKIKRPRH